MTFGHSSTRHPRFPAHLVLRTTGAAMLVGSLLSSAGCASYYAGQVKVPNTNQRLVVGHDSGPFEKAWVIENGKIESVKIVRKQK
jgi:hypothetical protein